MAAINDETLTNSRRKDSYLYSTDNFSLWRLFFTTQSAVGRLRDLELAALRVTPEQSGALFLLSKSKSTITEMADTWLRQRNSVSTLIDRMAKQGLVRKIKLPGQKDLEIEITPKGRELHNRIKNNSRIFDRVFADLSEKDRKVFAQYLKMILFRSLGMLDASKDLS